ncbi:type 1 glutamine amidotransferase domain-containing protein [Rhodobacteraceae bacterium]|nr:type 1 glutamine amidotransferase domain-containing protein [Paracoccaceae bacterium]
MKVLMVLTSHDEMGDTGHKTGFWLEELAAPYYAFKDAGAEITLASPKGGMPPLDPTSNGEDAQTDDTRRFDNDPEAQAALAQTLRLADVTQDGFDTVFYPGGHGPLWDLTNDATSVALIEAFHANAKPVAFVCHAPGVLRDVKGADGAPLVQGKTVTGFSNSEEAAVGLSDVVPYLVEDMLKDRGARYVAGPDWASHVVEDGLLITGQNPGSSAETATRLIAAVRAGAK